MTAPNLSVVVALCCLVAVKETNAFRSTAFLRKYHLASTSSVYMSDDWKDSSNDSNQWSGGLGDLMNTETDWQDMLSSRKDGSFWSSFEPSKEREDDDSASSTAAPTTEEEESEAWLDTLAALSAEEVEFNMKEADRADKVRQMEEWQFSPEVIASTLGVATTTELEKDDVAGMSDYRQGSYLDEIDLETVESHTQVSGFFRFCCIWSRHSKTHMLPCQVERDEETGDLVRTQMVYVDEHTCIGCTNCATIAQSTFFMHSEHGRARVFQQWGDDDETIQIAIETCPVDCIHYVPYDELERLEVERRDQNINFKARLVSQAEDGNALSHRVGGGMFTAPQVISSNMSARCNNCPSRGCKNCPMYGVGENPEFQRKEKERLARIERRKLQQQREAEQKSAEL